MHSNVLRVLGAINYIGLHMRLNMASMQMSHVRILVSTFNEINITYSYLKSIRPVVPELPSERSLHFPKG